MEIDLPRASNIGETFLHYLDKVGSTPGFDRKKHKFFFYLHYMDPHSPYAPPLPYYRLYAPSWENRIDQWMGIPNRHTWETITPRDVRLLRARYDAEIRFFDDQLRTLFAELRSRGWLDNTVVIFTADHGEEFFEHRGFGHGFTVFNETVRIPLILWYPRK